MDTLDILVSGGSIAGPAAALMLTRQGHRVTIVERSQSLRRGGQTVDLRGAGREVIDRLGLAAETGTRMLRQRGVVRVDENGKRGAAIPVEAFGGNGVVSTQEILRGDLAEALTSALPTDVQWLFGDTVVDIAQDADVVHVTFDSAAPRTFDLVIGADGLRSPVRRIAFTDDDTALRPIGLRYAWFTAPADGLGDRTDGWYLMHNARGGRVVSIRPSRDDAAVKVGFAVRGVDRVARTGAQQYALFDAAFADLGWITPHLLRAMRTADDWAYDDLAQVTLDSWTTGRVALVGDAGYCPTPLTGLGTTLALVGAYVLAGELARADGVVEALERYDAVMRPFVGPAQKLPPGSPAGFAPSSRVGLALAELSFAAATKWPMRDIWGKQFDKADGIDLPDYGASL